MQEKRAAMFSLVIYVLAPANGLLKQLPLNLDSAKIGLTFFQKSVQKPSAKKEKEKESFTFSPPQTVKDQTRKLDEIMTGSNLSD